MNEIIGDSNKRLHPGKMPVLTLDFEQSDSHTRMQVEKIT
jgi:hypothetical protein